MIFNGYVQCQLMAKCNIRQWLVIAFNGHLQNHSGTINGSKINISVNPLTAELDSRNMDDSGHPSLDDNDIPELQAGFEDSDPNIDGSENDSQNGQVGVAVYKQILILFNQFLVFSGFFVF